MPIISISLPEELKRMIQSLVERKKAFKNQSGFVRSAVNHFLSSEDACLDIEGDVDASEYQVHGQIMLSVKKGENEQRLLKDIYSFESKYQDSIVSFQMDSSTINTNTCTYTFHGSIFNFRSFVDDLDSIPDVSKLRYMISD